MSFFDLIHPDYEHNFYLSTNVLEIKCFMWCYVVVVSSFQLTNAFSETGYPAFYR